MELKYVALTDPLYQYLVASQSHAADPILAALRDETDRLGNDLSRMQISPEQGTFLTILTAACGVKNAIEVGTFTGYSSLCIARGLAAGGRLICIDQNPQWTSIGEKHWAKAGVRDRIDLRLGSAIPLLKELEPSVAFDLAFIDAEKTEYDAYFELLLPIVRPNGLILFDNMLWGGRLGGGPVSDAGGRAIEALNHKLANDKRVEAVLLSVADGIQMCRKLS
jgi:caffeoyl-CoA O-methyltransferase